MVGGVRLVWNMWGEDLVDRELLRFSERAASDMRPAYFAIVMDIKEAIGEQFESEGGRASGGWSPLKEETVAAKERAGYSPGTILRAENLLFESLTQESHPAQILHIDGQAMTFGSAVDYGPIHQSGAPSINLPARPILDFTELDRVGWVKQLQHYIVTGELGVGVAV